MLGTLPRTGRVLLPSSLTKGPGEFPESPPRSPPLTDSVDGLWQHSPASRGWSSAVEPWCGLDSLPPVGRPAWGAVARRPGLEVSALRQPGGRGLPASWAWPSQPGGRGLPASWAWPTQWLSSGPDQAGRPPGQVPVCHTRPPGSRCPSWPLLLFCSWSQPPNNHSSQERAAELRPVGTTTSSRRTLPDSLSQRPQQPAVCPVLLGPAQTHRPSAFPGIRLPRADRKTSQINNQRSSFVIVEKTHLLKLQPGRM